MMLWRDNPRYSRHEVPLRWFNAEVEALCIEEVANILPGWERYLPRPDAARAMAERALECPPLMLEGAE